MISFLFIPLYFFDSHIFQRRRCCCYCCWCVFSRSLLFMRFWINLHCFSSHFDTVLFMCKKNAHTFLFCISSFHSAIWMAQSGQYQTVLSLFSERKSDRLICYFQFPYTYALHTDTVLHILIRCRPFSFRIVCVIHSIHIQIVFVSHFMIRQHEFILNFNAPIFAPLPNSTHYKRLTHIHTRTRKTFSSRLRTVCALPFRGNLFPINLTVFR